MKKLLFSLGLLLITLLSFSQSRYISATTKKIVFTRDGGICQCCGSALNLEYDHIIPYSCGGTSTPGNIQLLCLKCNRSKSNGCYCKIHDKKVGNNCCNGSTPVATHHTSGNSSAQCMGTTKKGSRCRNRTTNANGYCHLHQ